MEINQMRYFLEVAETQHMTESARKLHIAQPALSQSIRRLEESLGVALFEPKGRGIQLTEYGNYLRAQLIPIIDRIDRIPEELDTMARLSSETIHINMLAASSLVTEAIIDYKYNHKDLQFQLLQNSNQELYDIEITSMPYHKSTLEDTPNQFVCSERIFLAVPNNRKYAGRSSIRIEEVLNEGFISLMGSTQFRTICDHFCQTLDLNPRIIFESDNPTSVKNMIASNMGVGFWPEYTWGDVNSDRVLLLELEEHSLKRDIVIRYLLNKIDNQNVLEFYAFLVKFFTEKTRR